MMDGGQRTEDESHDRLCDQQFRARRTEVRLWIMIVTVTVLSCTGSMYAQRMYMYMPRD